MVHPSYFTAFSILMNNEVDMKQDLDHSLLVFDLFFHLPLIF